MNPNKTLRKIFFLLLLTGSFCNESFSQRISAAHFDPFQTGDTISSTVYVGEVFGIAKNKFDSLYNKEPNKFKLPAITNSNYIIDIRLYETAPFPMGILRCYQLLFDRCFKVKVFNYSSPEFLEDTIKRIANADSIYDLLITNGLFSLIDYKSSFYSNHSIQILKSNEFKKSTLSEIKFDDGAWYSLEYKVGDIFNAISISNPFFYIQEYPDNQLFRRYCEIIQAFKRSYK